MIATTISGASRDWLTWHAAWGDRPTCTKVAKDARARLFSEPERPYGRGYRTLAELPTTHAREVLRALDEQVALIERREAKATAYTLRALATDSRRLRAALVEEAPQALPRRRAARSARKAATA